MIFKNKRLLIIISIVVFLLLIPVIAMQFTDEINWTLFDFFLAAALLLSTGLAIDFVLRKVKRTKYRILLSMAVLVLFLLVWAEIAVGLLEALLCGS